MDRLHLAIEKAREQRGRALKPVPAPPELAAVEVLPGPAPVPDGRDELWRALAPLELSGKARRDRRMTARSGGAEAIPYDQLRTRMLHQARKNGWRHIGLVSPTASCGKTTAAANLAFACARQPDLRLMLMDLDLRRPGLAELMGQTPGAGMEDVLRGQAAFSHHARRLGESVAIGFSNRPAEAPSELLQSVAAEERLAEIVETYDPDLVLFDLPPLLSTDDSFGFLGKVDAVLLIAAAEQSTNAQIDLSLRQLGELTQVMGIVLTKCRH